MSPASNGNWTIKVDGNVIGQCASVDWGQFTAYPLWDGSWEALQPVIHTSGGVTGGLQTIINSKENNMKTLYEIFVVDDEGDVILGPVYVVAKDQESAKFNADVYGTLADYGVEPSDVTIICTSKGMVKVEPKLKAITGTLSNTCGCGK